MRDSTLKALASIVNVSYTHEEWDELPMLVLVDEENSMGFAVLAGEGEVYEKIDAAAAQIIGAGVLNGPKIVSVILMAEAYMLKSEKTENDEGNAKKAEEMMKDIDALHDMGLRFQDHPTSIECKIFHAIDDEGQFSINWERGGKPEPGLAGGTGRIPEALTVFFDRVTHVKA